MESQIWLSARAGDQEAIAAVLEAHQGLIYSAAIRVGLNTVSSRVDPEDAAQAALIYAFECLMQGSCKDMTEDEFKLFCGRIGRNKARWFLRQQRQEGRDIRRESPLFDDSASITAGQEQVEAAEEVQALFELVDQDARRGPEHRRVLEMIKLGFQRHEIATELGLSIHQVAQRIKLIQAKARRDRTARELREVADELQEV